MKLNKIILFFCLSLPASVAMRLFQLYFTIDTKTGFFTEEFGNYGYTLLILIFVFCAATAVFAAFTFNQPENPPKGNIALSLASVLLAGAVLYETALGASPLSVVLWQILLLKLSGIATAAFLILFALAPVLKLRLPAAVYTVPTVYLIARMICDFTAISKLALISDNILLIAVYCILLIFMLNFAKLYNDTDKEKNFKKLLSYGLSAVILCFTNSIPHIILNFTSDFAYLHTPMSTNISVLFFGIFILTFLLSHFSRKNLSN